MVDFPSAQLEIVGGHWHRPRGSQRDLKGLAWLPSGASGHVVCVLALLMLWASVTHSFIHQIVLRPDSLVLRGALGCMVGRAQSPFSADWTNSRDADGRRDPRQVWELGPSPHGFSRPL